MKHNTLFLLAWGVMAIAAMFIGNDTAFWGSLVIYHMYLFKGDT